MKSLIDPAWLNAIKARDPEPEVRVYSIGHEGKSNLHLPGIGTKTFTWIQAAVQWIADKLNLGTAVFDRHDPTTNSHEGRVQIGEVVGKAVRHVGDRLNTLAAVYIYPQFKTRPLDVASIEAEIEYSHDGFQAWPTAIRNVSGIALGNSGIDNPGFPGATLLGAVQAYVQAFAGDIGSTTMNLSDVQAAVKELGLKPSQVFAVADIMSDATVAEESRKSYQDTLNANARLKQERDEARNSLNKAENDKAEAEKKFNQMQLRSKSSSLIDPILADPNRKLDDKAKVFIKRNLGNFTTTAADEDGLKTELGKFVDNMAAEYTALAKDVFGVTTPANPAAQPPTLPPGLFVVNPQQKQEQQAPTNQSPPTTRDEMLKAEMNPNLNPLIPGGKAAAELQKT